MIEPSPAASPSVGLFWGVMDAGQLHLVIVTTPLTEAEAYGEAFTDPRGHCDLWEGWQRLGAGGLRARGLPAAIAEFEYEDFPRGRVVYDTRTRRFTFYADRQLQRPFVLARLRHLFGLDNETVVIRSDLQYRSRGGINLTSPGEVASARRLVRDRAAPRPASVLLAPAVLDRAQGALVGLAVGDALGTTLEFTARDARPRHTEMTGGGPFDLAAGQWTDDTAMAMALADCLIESRGFDPADLMNRFVAWWRRGRYSCTGTCFDIGITTAAALARFEGDGNPFAGLTAANTGGNGSIMRLAPVALFALNNAAEADRIARDQSRTTHGAPQAVEACAYLVQILRSAILGEAEVLRSRRWMGADCDPLFPRHWQSDERDVLTLHPNADEAAIETIAQGTWRAKTRDQIRSTGYVVDTLEAALWAVESTHSFEEALMLAVNLGGDADTVGAVTGQLAGALYGLSAIPMRWLAPLAWRPRIEETTKRLVESMGSGDAF